MFTVEQRDAIPERLLEFAAADSQVIGAAVTGSDATGAGDQWSDVDLAFAIAGEASTALDRWTELIDRELGAVHHWDLRFGSSVYRVFLLDIGLEVDIAFTPAAEFGPRGPSWRTVFGDAADPQQTAPVDRDELIGLAWHHVLHARACIERHKPWQAEWLIGGIRGYVLALACRRLGYETRFARGADRLPPDLTAPLEGTLVRSLDETELRRALAVASEALVAELKRTDYELSERMEPIVLAAAGS